MSCTYHGLRACPQCDGPDCDTPALERAGLEETADGPGGYCDMATDPARPGGDRSAITFTIPLTPEQSAVLDRPGAMEYLQGMLEYRLSRWLSCNANRVSQEMFMGRE